VGAGLERSPLAGGQLICQESLQKRKF
jgi:hypothetical protein